jgi:hypothetical protein
MIRPGLLTASTNKVDHLGMSTDRVACLSIIDAPFVSVSLVWGLKQCFPLVGTLGHEWVPERYGQFATSWLDESRLFAGRKVSDDAPGSSSCWVFAFIGVENAFSPFRSEVEARVAHSDAPGRSERSGECDPFPRNDSQSQGLGTWTNTDWSLITWFLYR